MVEIRPATPADLRAFYGHDPVRRVRAWVADEDGVIVAVAGIEFIDGLAAMFANLGPAVRNRKVWIYKAALRVLGMARAMGLPLCAMADPEIPGAPRFLERLGFRLRTVQDGRAFYVLED